MAALKLVKGGDWAVFFLAAGFVAWLFVFLWHGGRGDTVIIRGGGKIVAQASLFTDRTIPVRGPLGTSIIRIRKQRVRVASDPSPLQYCVKQGWMSRSGESAICLPNQVSVEITGTTKPYDSLNY